MWLNPKRVLQPLVFFWKALSTPTVWWQQEQAVDFIIPSGVIEHGWLENPLCSWRFLARKITELSMVDFLIFQPGLIARRLCHSFSSSFEAAQPGASRMWCRKRSTRPLIFTQPSPIRKRATYISYITGPVQGRNLWKSWWLKHHETQWNICLRCRSHENSWRSLRTCPWTFHDFRSFGWANLMNAVYGSRGEPMVYPYLGGQNHPLKRAIFCACAIKQEWLRSTSNLRPSMRTLHYSLL